VRTFLSAAQKARLLKTDSSEFQELIQQKDAITNKDKQSLNFVLINGQQIVLTKNYVTSEIGPIAVRVGSTLFSTDLNDIGKGSPTEVMPLRQYFDTLPADKLDEFLLGVQLLNWANQMRYCSQCGENLLPSACDINLEIAMACTACDKNYYPQLSPVVITLIYRHKNNETELLLARGPRPNYSCIAGFVEAGETLEHALQREVLEEVGVQVKNIQYFGSQPWPFPSQMMIGFTAEWESGDIKLDTNELLDAQWFNKTQLPLLSVKSSIARKMIDAFLEK